MSEQLDDCPTCLEFPSRGGRTKTIDLEYRDDGTIAAEADAGDWTHYQFTSVLETRFGHERMPKIHEVFAVNGRFRALIAAPPQHRCGCYINGVKCGRPATTLMRFDDNENKPEFFCDACAEKQRVLCRCNGWAYTEEPLGAEAEESA